MQKNTQLVIGLLLIVLISTGVYVFVGSTDFGNEKFPPPASITKNPAIGTPVATPNNTASGTPGKNIPPMMPKSDVAYTCKDQKSFAMKFDLGTTMKITLTLNTPSGKKSFDMKPKPSKTDPILESSDGKVLLINKGMYSSVEEGGTATYAECKVVQ
jgi:hypothetical protein